MEHRPGGGRPWRRRRLHRLEPGRDQLHRPRHPGRQRQGQHGAAVLLGRARARGHDGRQPLRRVALVPADGRGLRRDRRRVRRREPRPRVDPRRGLEQHRRARHRAAGQRPRCRGERPARRHHLRGLPLAVGELEDARDGRDRQVHARPGRRRDRTHPGHRRPGQRHLRRPLGHAPRVGLRGCPGDHPRLHARAVQRGHPRLPGLRSPVRTASPWSSTRCSGRADGQLRRTRNSPRRAS